jgi:DNA-binding transcriptional LysR family regulator
MKFIQLRNLIAVIEAGTFRQAAKNLHLSQSSISKSLQQLEDEIGAEILHRGARGVIPTAAGQALLSRAKLIEAELRHARNDVQMIQGAQVAKSGSASPRLSRWGCFRARSSTSRRRIPA